jgi:antitoxin (DNA-binding transcriptional repressor) of toxin-antitoxin stability system
MIHVTVNEAQARLPELLAVAEAGEAIEIRTTAGRSFHLIAQPTEGPDGVTDPAWPGFPEAESCKGMIWMADDFDAPLAVVPPRSPRPRPPVTGVPRAGSCAGLFVVPDDFDAPLEELGEYME